MVESRGGSPGGRELGDRGPSSASLSLSLSLDDEASACLAGLERGLEGWASLLARRDDLRARLVQLDDLPILRIEKDRMIVAVAFGSRTWPALTPREKDIVRLLGHGHGNSGIGSKLSISEATVRRHLQSIFAKCDVHSRAHAVRRLLLEDLSSP